MKPKPYVYNRKEIDYNNSQENWNYLKSCVDEHRASSEKELEQAQAQYTAATDLESRVSLMIGADAVDEHSFYKLHLMIRHDWDEKTASEQASIICFERHPPESFHGMYHRSQKVGDQTLSTKKASYLCEHVNDVTLYYWKYLIVTIYYIQDYTFFQLRYFYNVLKKRLDDRQRKPEITIVETEDMIRMLKSRRLLKRFKKEHPAVYAAYLMDK